MAIQSHQHRISEPTEEGGGGGEHLFLLDALFCKEEQRWEDEEEVEEDAPGEDRPGHGRETSSLLPLLLLQQDLYWEDEELRSLFSREEVQREDSCLGEEHSVNSGSVLADRGEAVEWMLGVSAHHGFSALTVILAIDYVDRFLSRLLVKNDKPWIIQLLSVACLSLAAKVEETYVPILSHFQVEGAKYVFEAKAVQRMELLVLSTLRWKMHPVTPLSFLDHIIRRLGLKSDVHWEFFRRCEALLLAVVSDSRSVGYLPSVLATAAMLHVIEEVETCNPLERKAQLLRVLRMSKENVEGCYQLILGMSTAQIVCRGITNSNKRKLDQSQGSSSGGAPASPSTDSGDDIFSDFSWSSGSSLSPSHKDHHQPPVKRSRVQLPERSNLCNNSTGKLPPLGQVFVDAMHSPP